MKPIYFPYTFVPSVIAEAGAACFGQMIVYQPSGMEVPPQMMEAEKKGLLDIRVPVKGDEEKIFSVLTDHKRWADVHKDRDAIRSTLPWHQKNRPPFFKESSIMKIKEDIQRKIHNTDKAPEGSDPLFVARVFLHMAHEFDMQNDDIDQHLRQLNRMEHELMKNLQGSEMIFDKNGMGEKVSSLNYPSDFMVLERIEAWSELMLHEQKENMTSGLFVTGNRSIFTHMIENSPAGDMVLDIETIPMRENPIDESQEWRDSLMKNIEKYSNNPWPVVIDEPLHVPVPGKTGRRTSLSLYVVPGENPIDLFGRFCLHGLDFAYEQNKGRKIANTLLGLFEVHP